MVRYTFTNRNFPAGNPVANAIVIVVGAVAILASLVVGLFAAIVLGTALLVLAAVFGIRVWWLRRKTTRSDTAAGSTSASTRAGPQTIEGEYRIVTDERDDARR